MELCHHGYYWQPLLASLLGTRRSTATAADPTVATTIYSRITCFFEPLVFHQIPITALRVLKKMHI